MQSLLTKPPEKNDIYAALCKKSFKHFIKYFWLDVSTDPFIDNWAIDCMADHLQAVRDGRITDLVITVPPGMAKSITVSVMFSAWLWVNDPEFNTITSTRDPANAKRDASRFYNLIKSENFRALYGDLFTVGYEARKEQGMKISEDIKDIHNSKKGYRRSVTTGAMTTGARGKIILLDDGNDRTDVYSELKRNNINDYVFKTLYSRNFAKLGGAIVIVQQRLHENDIAGMAIAKGFSHLCIPMEYDHDLSSMPLPEWSDPREPGEFINPELYDENSKKRTILSLGSLEYDTQYQQYPSIQGGNIIKSEWIKDNPLPKNKDGDLHFNNCLMTFDLTFKGKKTSDFVVGQFWIENKQDYWLVDEIRGKWGFTDQRKQMLWFYEKWKPYKLLIEDAANSQAIIESIRDIIPSVMTWKPTVSKERRLDSVAPMFEAGRININSEKFQTTIKELLVFPNGKHDDGVDTASMALLNMKNDHSFFMVDHSRL